jgi:hypothetical protein
MQSKMRKLLTVITEAAIEGLIIKDVERLGAKGYTVTDVRGKGSRGVRNSAWDSSGNIRVEVICVEETAQAIAAHLQSRYFENYAMTLFMQDVVVLRPEKY